MNKRAHDKMKWLAWLGIAFLALGTTIQAADYISANTIVAFGDSITYGDQTSTGGPKTAYPRYLGGMIGKSVINCGKGGEAVANGSVRIGTVISTYHPDLMLIMDGINDLWWKGTSFQRIQTLLDSMILQCQEAGSWVVLATVTPATDSTLNNKFASFNDAYIYSLASLRNVPVAEVYQAITSQSGWRTRLMNNLPDDPVHPNDAGEVVIAQAFNTAIRNAHDNAIVITPSSVSVPEGGTATFNVKLSDLPDTTVTVTISKVSGDGDIHLTSSTTLSFTPANGTSDQTVSVAADEDRDFINGQAVFVCQAPQFSDQQVTITEQENDQPFPVKQINCGGPVVGDWQADACFNSGLVWSTSATIANAGSVPPAIYQTERYAKNLVYSMDDLPNGDYQVNLHFAEIYYGVANARLFNVFIEGQQRLTSFDVFAAAGGKNRAFVGQFVVSVTDGNGLQVALNTVKDDATLSGVEVIPMGPAIVVSPAAPVIGEGGTTNFLVKLNEMPAQDKTVTVSRVSGDTDINLVSGDLLYFTPTNWNVYQPVNLAAREDIDFINGQAVFVCQAPQFYERRVTATEQENDQPFPVKQINCGGPAVGDWQADAYFNSGLVWSTSATIVNTGSAPSAIYQTERYAKNLLYNLSDLPNGNYQVRLHFAETYYGVANARLFNVFIEGQQKLASFDVFSAAGGKNRAAIRTFDVFVTDGNGLQVALNTVKDDAVISGIEVLSLGPAIVVNPATATIGEGGTTNFLVKLNTTPIQDTTVTVSRLSGDTDINVTSGNVLSFTPDNWNVYQPVNLAAGEDIDFINGQAVFVCQAPDFLDQRVTVTEQENDQPVLVKQINCGGSVVGDWQADALFNSGLVWSTSATIANAGSVPPAIYQTERYAKNLVYSMADLPNGDYQVKLHFAEIYYGVAKARLFNVFIEGQQKLASFDVFAAASGKNRAVVSTFTVPVTDGNGLQITLNTVKDDATLSGIEVLALFPWPGDGSGGAPMPATMKIKSGSVFPRPVDVLTSSGEEPHTNGWNVVDGDTNTMWVGQTNAGGWYCSLVYDPAVTVHQLTLDLVGGSLSNVLYLYSVDASNWYDLVPALSNGPVSLHYLWLIIPAGQPPTAVPAIEEIQIH